MKTKTRTKPIRSYKFGTLSLYYDNRYYFPASIKKSTRRDEKPYEIQAVFYTYKWYQDTFYITREFKQFLLKHLKTEI